jgi:hypothetical protein
MSIFDQQQQQVETQINIVGKLDSVALDRLLGQTWPKSQLSAIDEPKKPRTHGTLPPIWNVPFSRKPSFCGREALIADLRDALVSTRHTNTPHALFGLGGVGKTQLVVEYAYRHMADYNLVWWVRSGDALSLASDYARLATELDLPEKEARDQSVIVQAVQRLLRREHGWLLIFDDASSPD